MLGTEFVPKADFSETQINFYTPVGSSLEVTEARAAPGRRRAARIARGALHRHHDQQRQARRARSTRTVYVRLIDRKERTRSVEQLTVPLRERLARIPGITVTNVGVTRPRRRQEPPVLGAGQRPGRTGAPGDADHWRSCATFPAWSTWTARSSPTSRRVAIDVRRDAASDLGLNVSAHRRHAAHAGGRRRRWATGAPPTARTTTCNVRLAPGQPRARRPTCSSLPLVRGQPTADGSARVVRLSQVAEVRALHRPQPDQPARPEPRDQRSTPTRSAAAAARSRPTSAPCSTASPGRPATATASAARPRTCRSRFDYAVGALALAVVFIYMILASQFSSFLQPLALMSVAAADADRRRAGAADVPLDAEHVLDHRHRHADGAGDEERDPAGRLRDPLAPRTAAAWTRDARRCCRRRACGCGRS